MPGDRCWNFKVLKKHLKDLPCKLQLHNRRLSKEEAPELFELFERFNIKPPLVCVSEEKGIVNASLGIFGVVVYGDLLRNTKANEQFALILHEIGHRRNFYLSVPQAILLFFQLFVPLALIIYGLLVIRSFIETGFSFIVLISYILSVFFWRVLIAYFVSLLSRFSEKRADLFAVKVLKEYKYWLSDALKRMNELDTLGYRPTPKLESFLFYLSLYPFKTHPSIEERVRYIENLKP
jgi:Zn-dependent protease with chaperone function